MKWKPMPIDNNLPIYCISDIHGNLTALRRFFDIIRKIKCNIIVLGDIIDYGPRSIECLNILCSDKRVKQIIRGNHEQLLYDKELRKRLKSDRGRDSIIKTELEFKEYGILNEVSDFFKSLPESFYENGTLYVHASIGDDKIWGNILEDIICIPLNVNTIVYGHTHKAEDDELIEGETLLNCGSIGQSRDGKHLASFIELLPHEYNIIYFDYDVEAEITYAEKIKYPRHEYYRERLRKKC